MSRKKYFKLVFFIFLLGNLSQGYSQSVDKIRHELRALGFENIRTNYRDGKLIVSIENISYRWQVNALSQALDAISDSMKDSVTVKLILLENEIPQLLVEVNPWLWKNFRNKDITGVESISGFKVMVNTREEWQKLKKLKAENKSFGKMDLVLYPQFAYKNTLLSKLYEVQLNLAPAIELPLGKGLNFTGQVIFPIVNELGYEGDFIRPGFITLTKDFKFLKQNFGKLSIGNFSNTRYGADLWIKHYLPNENWSIELNAGLTGSSHFFDYKWTRSSLNTFTWITSVSHFYTRYNLRLKLSAARYLYGDYGLMASCTRFFGETAFGFYGMLGENSINGGFHVSIPFPYKERSHRKYFRISYPTHFEMNYDAGTEFLNGQSYGTSPSKNRIHDNNYPRYISNELIHLKK